MALVEISEEQRVQGFQALNPEFKYVLEEKQVDKELMELLGHFGIVDADTFSAIASDEVSLRAMMKNDLNLDAEGPITVRVRAAKLVNAWRAARERLKKQAEADAEARAEGRPRELPRTNQVSLRRAYERVHGEVEDNIFPSNAYNSERITQIEEGEYKAEALSQVVSFELAREESGDTDLSLTLTKSSTVKLTRGKVTVPMPSSPEELRERYDTMIMHWELMKMRHPDREIFRQMSAKSWMSVLNYLLGPKVYKYKSNRGTSLSWEDLLGYEFEIRKRAMRRITSHNVTIHEALQEAMENYELRAMQFTLPLLSTSSRSGGRARSRTPKREPKHPNTEGKGKGKSKGNNWDAKGKGRDTGKGKGGGKQEQTPEQQAAGKLYNEAKKRGTQFNYKHGKWNVCVRYNKLACPWGEQCQNAHVCLKCGEKHPYPDCPRK